MSSRRLLTGWTLLAWLAVGFWQGALAAGGGGTPVQPAGRFRVPGNPSPALARLFTPRHAPAGTFQVTVLGGGIGRATQAVLEAVRQAGASAPAGVPSVRKMDPLDAFGEAGTYDRTTVARLYTGRRAEVARIPVERDGRTVAAVTLISPYPDPTLSRLEEGTMVIVMHLNRSQESGVRSR